MKTVPPPSHVTAEIGRSTRIPIEVTNTAKEIDGYTAIVDGIDPSWVRLERPLVTVFPDTSDVIVIHLDIPDHCQAGDYLIDVRVISAIDPYRESSQDFWLTVPPQPAFEIQIHPSVITTGAKAATQVSVVNTGNCDVSVGLTAVEPSREVNCELSTPRMTVPYRSTVDSILELRGKRPWFGQPVARTIDITGRSDALVADQVLRLNQKARIPRGAITVLTLLLIIALWATMFLLGIRWLRSDTVAKKATADEVDEGREGIPLDLIRGTVFGQVVGGPDLEGIPAVTVTAFRVADVPVNPLFPSSAAGQKLDAVASGGTGDDGTYRLRTLIPGDYLFYFSAPGFGDVWFPGEFGTATPQTIERLKPLELPRIPMLGELGTVSATIELPANTDLSRLDEIFTVEIVTLDPVVEPIGFRRAPRAGVGSASCTMTADNPVPGDPTPTATVTCINVPTPGEYLIEIRSDEGFETQRIEVSLRGGDQAVVDTARLTGEPGTITGTVESANSPSRVLAGAAITVSNGQFESRVFSDSSGRYVVDDLPTPADYVIDITLDGYVGQTSALALLPAQNRTVNALLVAGIGSIEGLVVGDVAGSSTLVPLGAVDVIVSGDRSSATTATLTDGTPGAFRVEGLAVPGTYTVTFRVDGYQTETRIVQFDAARFQDLGTIEMSSSTGAVSGTAIDPLLRPVIGAEVELTDGVNVRTTATTAPLGAFAFDDISPGTYSIVVRATDASGNLAIYSVLRDIGAGDPLDLGALPVPLAAFGRISGTVTDSSGDGTGGLGNVFVVLSQAGSTRTTSTDSSGFFAFDNVDVPGTYGIEFNLENHELVALADGAGDPIVDKSVSLSVDSNDGTATVNAQLRPIPGPVRGTIRNDTDSSRRLSGAHVQFIDPATGVPVADDVTDDAGLFYIAALVPNTYDVDIRWCDDANYAVLRPPLVLDDVLIPAGGIDLGAIQMDLVPFTQDIDQERIDHCPVVAASAATTSTATTTVTTTTTTTTTTPTSTTTIAPPPTP